MPIERTDLVYLVLLPLFTSLLIRFFNRLLPSRWIGWIGSLSVLGSFLWALYLANEFLYLIPERRKFLQDLFVWILVGDLTIPFRFLLDPLSLTMVVVVTGVGFLIHVYSIGYMEKDPRFPHFFAYLNLFVAFMLILVLAGNLPVMFVGWEGVGLCSYLLIGFWFSEEKNALAGRKAFVVNRIGDAGFLLGIFLLYAVLKTTDFVVLEERFALGRLSLPGGITDLVAVLLFLGAVGKSAQIPLYVWLPDAMAGPTPVSALIHAATMVTAGVYMIARLHPVYALAPSVSEFIIWLSAITACFSALIACAQTDIKRILAYSTISQLGYMFVGVGTTFYTSGIFHLFTHAFFKALLFLGAGAVIVALEHTHAVKDPQDIRQMGGLYRKLPFTYWVFFIGTLAISGVPFFSGFFSKDEILWNALSSPLGSPNLFFLLLFTSGLTAFYMFRLFFTVFYGEFRGEKEAYSHLHDPPNVMKIPLGVLAVGSVLAGYIGLPHLFSIPNVFEDFLSPVFAFVRKERWDFVYLFGMAVGEGTAMVFSILVSGVGIFLAYLFCLQRVDWKEKVTRWIYPLYTLLKNKFFVDEIYDWFLVRPLYFLAQFFVFRILDRIVVDGNIEGIGRGVRGVGGILQGISSGHLSIYLLFFGFVVLVLFWVFPF